MVQTVRWDPPSLHRFHRAFFLRTDNLQVAQGTLGHSRSTAPPAVHRLQLHHSKPHSLFQVAQKQEATSFHVMIVCLFLLDRK